MDVRAKQLLSYRVVRLTLACVSVVSPHVISIVIPFRSFASLTCQNLYFWGMANFLMES
jgi:hypothetical protein